MNLDLALVAGWLHHPQHDDSRSERRDRPVVPDLPGSIVDLHAEGLFLTHREQAVLHLVGADAKRLRFHYRHVPTDREFDVRQLPAIYLGPYRVAVMHGDRDAHRAVIEAAIDAAYGFRAEQLCA